MGEWVYHHPVLVLFGMLIEKRDARRNRRVLRGIIQKVKGHWIIIPRPHSPGLQPFEKFRGNFDWLFAENICGYQNRAKPAVRPAEAQTIQPSVK